MDSIINLAGQISTDYCIVQCYLEFKSRVWPKQTYRKPLGWYLAKQQLLKYIYKVKSVKAVAPVIPARLF
jgi:hypothetical protein